MYSCRKCVFLSCCPGGGGGGGENDVHSRVQYKTELEMHL